METAALCGRFRIRRPSGFVVAFARGDQWFPSRVAPHWTDDDAPALPSSGMRKHREWRVVFAQNAFRVAGNGRCIGVRRMPGADFFSRNADAVVDVSALALRVAMDMRDIAKVLF